MRINLTCRLLLLTRRTYLLMSIFNINLRVLLSLFTIKTWIFGQHWCRRLILSYIDIFNHGISDCLGKLGICVVGKLWKVRCRLLPLRTVRYGLFTFATLRKEVSQCLAVHWTILMREHASVILNDLVRWSNCRCAFSHNFWFFYLCDMCGLRVIPFYDIIWFAKTFKIAMNWLFVSWHFRWVGTLCHNFIFSTSITLFDLSSSYWCKWITSQLNMLINTFCRLRHTLIDSLTYDVILLVLIKLS